MQVPPAKQSSALLLLGHGSTANADSSEPVRRHADALRSRGIFASVHCAFWKEEPAFHQALWQIEQSEVYVVPVFISEGYFTRRIIPRELQLETETPTNLIDGKTVHYCAPVGSHPSMTERLLERAASMIGNHPKNEVALIIVGHGTGMDKNSATAVTQQVNALRDRNTGFADIIDAYLDETPAIADWRQLTDAPHIVVVPFFIADGLHSREDIPEALGIGRHPEDIPHTVDGRHIYYSRAIGTGPAIADVILDQIADFKESNHPPRPIAVDTGSSVDFIHWLKENLPARIGELTIQYNDKAGSDVFTVHHHQDSLSDPTVSPLIPQNQTFDGRIARRLTLFDETGDYRPLRTAPTLRRGWKYQTASSPELLQLIDSIYPGIIGHWRRDRQNRLTPVALADSLARQSGRAARIADLPPATVRHTVFCTCDTVCLKQRRWALAADQVAPTPGNPLENSLPLPCAEACQYLISQLMEKLD